MYLLNGRLDRGLCCIQARWTWATWAGGPSRIETVNPTRTVKKRGEDVENDRFKYRITAGKIRAVARDPCI